MKKIIFSIIFLTIGIITFLQKREKQMLEIKIAYTYPESVMSLDPANIISLPQANLVENLYTRLLDYDENGQLQCTLCESFEINNNELIFQIKKGVKTISGYELSAKDVHQSISRLFDLNSNTHGNLTSFISKKEDLTFEGNIFKIKLIKAHFSHFVLPLLASMDFSIIPSISINSENKIIDFKNTFGPYYVYEDNPNGNLILYANVNHPYFSIDMPSKISLIYTEPKDVIDGFLKNKYDVIDITNYPRTIVYEELFQQKIKKFNSVSTIPINLFFLNITPATSKKFSQEQIFYALNVIKDKYLSFRTYGYGFKEQVEFIPPNGNGHLDNSKRFELEKVRNIKLKPSFSEPIVLGVLKPSFDKVVKAFEDHPEIKIVNWIEDPSFLPIDKRPDVTIQTTDSSFNEDVSLLSYNFSMENFGVSKAEGDIWIKNYINIENKENRIKALQSLFFNLLSKPVIYPIGASPYWAIAREDLELNFPKLFPGSHWWKIRKK